MRRAWWRAVECFAAVPTCRDCPCADKRQHGSGLPRPQHEIDHLKGTLYVDVMDYEVFPEDEDKEEDNVESKEKEL